MAVKTGDLTEKITIRISEQLKAQILLHALEKNMNVAEYLRELIEKEMEKK